MNTSCVKLKTGVVFVYQILRIMQLSLSTGRLHKGFSTKCTTATLLRKVLMNTSMSCKVTVCGSFGTWLPDCLPEKTKNYAQWYTRKLCVHLNPAPYQTT